MGRFSPADLERVARLCRLGLDEDERVRLAEQLDAITASFSDLAAWAEGLPGPEAEACAPLRPDEPIPAPEDEVEGILRAATLVEAGTRLVVGPRGGA